MEVKSKDEEASRRKEQKVRGWGLPCRRMPPAPGQPHLLPGPCTISCPRCGLPCALGLGTPR